MEPPTSIARMRNVALAVVKCVKINPAAAHEGHLSHAMVRWGALIHCFGVSYNLLHPAGCVYVQVTIIHFISCRSNVRSQAPHARLYRCWACWALGNFFFSRNIIKKQPVSAVKSTEGVVSLVMCENPCHFSDRGIH